MQGVDDQIKSRMDAFRGNEQKLAQRYQASQELLDLLALQKLKSEKDEVARSMQMQMQNSPQTIKQQREAEMVQASKQDIAKGVMGALQQKQAQQQANLQRIAQSGVAGRAPTMRMAEGGIVGFAPGGAVDFNDFDEAMSYQDRVDLINAMDIPEDEKVALLQKLSQEATQTKDAPTPAENRLMLDKDDLVMPDMSSVPAFPDNIDPESLKVDYSSNPYTETAAAGITTLAGTDPNQAFDDMYDRQMDKGARTLGEELQVANLQSERQGIEKALLDPDKLAKDRRMATLIGMAGKSTLGLTGAGGAAGAMNAQRTQERARTKLFNEREDAFMDELNRSQDIRREAAGRAGTAYSDASADRRAGIQSAATMATGYDDKLTSEAEMVLNAKIANQNTDLARRKEAVQSARDAASNANKTLVTNIATELSLLRTQVEKERNSLTAQGNMYQYLTTAMSNVSAKITSAETALRDAANVAIAEIDADMKLDDTAKAKAKLEIRQQLKTDINAATADATKLLNQLMQDQQAAAGQINTRTASGSRQFKVIR